MISRSFQSLEAKQGSPRLVAVSDRTDCFVRSDLQEDTQSAVAAESARQQPDVAAVRKEVEHSELEVVGSVRPTLRFHEPPGLAYELRNRAAPVFRVLLSPVDSLPKGHSAESAEFAELAAEPLSELAVEPLFGQEVSNANRQLENWNCFALALASASHSLARFD